MQSFFNRRKRPRNVVPISDTAPWTLYGSQRAKKGVKPLRPSSKAINSKLYIFLGDITELQVDSIVNAANNSLLGGGGVDGAIHAAAGPALREECSKLGGCSTGDAKITKGHNLPSKHIIHTVGPRGKKPDVLRSCYSRCFELMEEHELKSIAFPCVSTGIYGYPNQAAAEVAIETARDFLEKNHQQVDAVIFCLFTNKDIEAYHQILPAYFPLSSKDDVKSGEVEDGGKDESGEGKEGELNEEASVNKEAAQANTATDADVDSGWETDEETDNGAKCQDVSETLNQEETEPMSQEQQESTSQEQAEPMSQEQAEHMSQEQSESLNQEQSEPMSQEPMSCQNEEEDKGIQDQSEENTAGTSKEELV